MLGIPCHSLNVHEETVLRGGGEWMRKSARHPAGACEVPLPGPQSSPTTQGSPSKVLLRPAASTGHMS